MTKTWVRTLLHLTPRYKSANYLLENERITTIIKGKITLAVVQIADIYVNKIDLYVKKSQTVSKGQRIGMIKLGSQVDLLLPDQNSITIKVKEGDRVKAGESVLAEFL